jgi:CheY-like chemotaxis protein
MAIARDETMLPSAQILIVEDEALIAYDLARRLRRFGYRVVGLVATGPEAIEKAVTLRPDVVLMDIRLRGEMDGIEAAQSIQARAPIPVVYMSVFTDPATLARTTRTHAAGYLRKPFQNDKLQQALHQALMQQPLEGP